MQIIDLNSRTRECLRVFLDPAWPGYASVEFQSKADPEKTRIEWMPLADFALKNPTLTALFDGHSTTAAEDTSGIVTTTGADTLVDKNASWTPNIYAGYFLWISRGPGDGTTRTILKNTKTILYVDKPWDTKPTRDSQYVVVQQLPENTAPSGNVLPSTRTHKVKQKLMPK